MMSQFAGKSSVVVSVVVLSGAIASCRTELVQTHTQIVVQDPVPEPASGGTTVTATATVQVRGSQRANTPRTTVPRQTTGSNQTATDVVAAPITRCYADDERHPQNVVDLSTGRGHACVALADGTVRCWGWNYDGQLGDGSRGGQPAPIVVEGLSDITQVSVGWDFSCALSRSGSVWCWGENDYGQVGTDSRDTDRPVQVRGISQAVSLSVGHTHACALGRDHQIRCWGRNQFGELGDGTSTQRAHPVVAQLGRGGAAALAAGSGSTCALREDGSVWCAGWLTNAQRLTRVDGLSPGILGISLGNNFACARTVEGNGWCWGEGFAGQLGSENVTEVHVPRAVRGLTEMSQISLGPHGGCGVKSNGQLWCWGRVGNDEHASGQPPFAVASLSDVAQVAVGENFVCARMVAGGVCCFGDDHFGQLGDNDGRGPQSVEHPVPVRW